ncbi:MAG: hypothetical protein WB662_02200 [Methyloceanibacter sp.]
MRNNVPGGENVGEFPPSGVERAGGARGEGLIERLRRRIRALEQVPVSLAFPPAPGAGLPRPACSLLLSPCIVSSYPSPLPGKEAPPLSKLAAGGLHEIRAAAYRDQPAALAFALAFLGERLARRDSASPVLWCLMERAAREWGAPYGPGLLAFGLDPALFLIVETRNTLDVAWALEEGLKSGAFVAALGQVEVEVPLVARRLGLAAQTSRTPCLLLSGHQGGGLPGTLTRWRIGAAGSSLASFDASAPGAPCWHLTLERCRGTAPERSWTVEFSHGAYGFRLAAAFADRAAQAGKPRRALSG